MKRRSVPDLETALEGRLEGARRVAIVGIGDELSRHDRLGILASRDLEALRLPGVKVIIAGTMPESFTGPIRRWSPDHVVLIDAADFLARPGSVAVIGAHDIRGSRLSTHALPLSLLIRYLESDVGTPVTLIGIQPDLGAHGPASTAAEIAGVTRLLAALHRVLGSLGSGGRSREASRPRPLRRRSRSRAQSAASTGRRPGPGSGRSRQA